MTRNTLIVLATLVVQAVCALFFVSDILFSVLGIYARPIAWRTREFLEIGAAVGLILGFVLGAVAFFRLARERRHAEEKLRRASSAFMELLEERFGDWGLTPSERDVALFAIKGMSTSEIAALRNVAEGTVKAQTNAIYRKAGVSGRSQLLSLFIEDLMEARPVAKKRHPLPEGNSPIQPTDAAPISFRRISNPPYRPPPASSGSDPSGQR